jgi:hypothetical protein
VVQLPADTSGARLDLDCRRLDDPRGAGKAGRLGIEDHDAVREREGLHAKIVGPACAAWLAVRATFGGSRRSKARFRPLPKPALVVNAWLMDDPTQPKPSDLLAAMIDFRDAVAAAFARVDARLAQVDTRFAELESRMDGRFDRVERRLAKLDDRVLGMERRRKR